MTIPLSSQNRGSTQRFALLGASTGESYSRVLKRNPLSDGKVGGEERGYLQGRRCEMFAGPRAAGECGEDSGAGPAARQRQRRVVAPRKSRSVVAVPAY